MLRPARRPPAASRSRSSAATSAASRRTATSSSRRCARPEFLAGDTTTDFIERVAPARSLEPGDDELLRAARTAALWIQGSNRADAGVLRAAPSGWRNARLPDQRVGFRVGAQEIHVCYGRCATGASA